MSYFARVIARTLGDVKRSVRPSVALDLIPENHSETKNTSSTSRLKKYVLSETKIKEDMTSPAFHVGKGNIPAAYTKKIEPINEPTSHDAIPAELPHSEPQKSVDDKDKAGVEAFDRSDTQQLSKPIHSLDHNSPNIAQNMTNLSSISNPTFDPAPLTDIRIIRGNAEIPSLYTDPSAIPPGSLVTDNKINEKQPASEKHSDSTQHMSLFTENAALSPGSKAQNGDQARYPSLVPTVSNRVKHLGNMVARSEERVVTINIGRIEVRGDKPPEPSVRPKHKFTPALSLADYLRQRSEGKLG